MPLIISLFFHLLLFLGGGFMPKFLSENRDGTPLLEEKRELSASFNLKKSKISDLKNSTKKDISSEAKGISQDQVPKTKNSDKDIRKKTAPKNKKNLTEKKNESLPVKEVLEEESFSNSSFSDDKIEENLNSPVFNENIFTTLGDGSYAVKNQGVSGINYKFLSNPDPQFPSSAKKLGFSKTIEIRVKFLINLEGKVEDIIFYGDDPGMGFREEVRRALKNWKVTPVTLDGKKVKLFFYKGFTFKVN